MLLLFEIFSLSIFHHFLPVSTFPIREPLFVAVNRPTANLGRKMKSNFSVFFFIRHSVGDELEEEKKKRGKRAMKTNERTNLAKRTILPIEHTRYVLLG